MIDDWVWFAVGVVTYATSLRLALQLGRRERVPVEERRATTCGCEHDYALHDANGLCAAQVRRPHYEKTGSRNGHEYLRCPCQRFTGELPPHELIDRFQPPPIPPSPPLPSRDELSLRRRERSAASDEGAPK